MSGDFWLDWAVMAVSLFNTILLLWLSLTVLLNAERRTYGVWLVGGGLLLGGAFFLSHTAILGYGVDYFSRDLDFWWHAGWVPVIILPLAWYGIMLWYSGYWEKSPSPLRRRHRPWLGLVTLMTVGIVGLLIFANPLPAFSQIATLNFNATLSIKGVPILILLYPMYIFACMGLSLDSLLHPGPSGRVMGVQARRRARPWLVAASLALLIVSLLVGWVMLWIILNARQRSFTAGIAGTVAWFDLVIASLIGIVILLMGQAIVSYEVFTGKTLPRRGLQRYWQRAIILAAGYSLLVGWGLSAALHPIYSLLLSTLLMTAFYALLSWRSYGEREHFIENLRPFIVSQGLYEQLLSLPDPPDTIITGENSIGPAAQADVRTPFHALCRDILNTRQACLIPLGPLATLAGPALTYPPDRIISLTPIAGLAVQLNDPQTLIYPIEPDGYAGAAWAVPLWSERGLAGVLLLAEKADGGLYAQEEIEVARLIGERLVDTQASSEMARHLMVLQRQRLAESQVLDQRTRRILHDDILPRLHTALLDLTSAASQSTAPQGDPSPGDALTLLAEVHREISNLLQDLPGASPPELKRLGLIEALRQVIAGELKNHFDEVTWQISPEVEQSVRSLPPLAAEVLFFAAREAMRNSARHGRSLEGKSPLHLKIQATDVKDLEMIIEDNGVGLGETELYTSGSKQGLALHSTLMAVVGGSLAVESLPGKLTRVLLTLPLP